MREIERERARERGEGKKKTRKDCSILNEHYGLSVDSIVGRKNRAKLLLVSMTFYIVAVNLLGFWSVPTLKCI